MDVVAIRLNDNLGVRKSLMLGFCISACASTMIACARSIEFLLVVLFFVYPFGLAMGIPMLNVAIKRYTNNNTRGFAFGIYYSVMNMAALVSGPLVDAFNGESYILH
jgi:MFS family permease